MSPGPYLIRTKYTLLLAITWLPAMLSSGCAWKGNTSTLDPKGPVARVQFDLFMVTVWVSLFLFIVVGGAFLYAVWKYRERPGEPERSIPQDTHGNPLVEIGLISASVFMLVIIAVPTVRAIWYTQGVPEKPENPLGSYYEGEHLSEGEAGNHLTIVAEGYQWWWAFEYPQLGVTTGNEFVIPAGKTVKVELRSMDVIHSFWLPKIAGKVDLIPGRSNSMWIQAGESYDYWSRETGGSREEYQTYLEEEIYGMYYGQCAEFCGESHAYMLFRAKVVSDEEFNQWIDQQKTPAPAPDGRGDWSAWMRRARSEPESLKGDTIQQGAHLYHTKGGCIQCHKIEGSPSSSGVIGPNLTKVGGRTSLGAGWMDHYNPDTDTIDEDRQFENLVSWIYESQDIKPGNLMYNGSNALENIIHPRDPSKEPLTREDVEKIAAWLQTLK